VIGERGDVRLLIVHAEGDEALREIDGGRDAPGDERAPVT
jgi:hypothetical protein